MRAHGRRGRPHGADAAGAQAGRAHGARSPSIYLASSGQPIRPAASPTATALHGLWIVDHGSGEPIFDTAHRVDRSAASDPFREVTTKPFGSVEAAVALGLAPRYNGGPLPSSPPPDGSSTSGSPARPLTAANPRQRLCRACDPGSEVTTVWIGRFEAFEDLRSEIREDLLIGRSASARFLGREAG